MTSYAIEATGLTKRFGKTQTLDGVDLAAREGTVLGFLGPNGAGITVHELSLHLPSLDEVFLTLTGRPSSDSSNDLLEGAAA